MLESQFKKNTVTIGFFSLFNIVVAVFSLLSVKKAMTIEFNRMACDVYIKNVFDTSVGRMVTDISAAIITTSVIVFGIAVAALVLYRKNQFEKEYWMFVVIDCLMVCTTVFRLIITACMIFHEMPNLTLMFSTVFYCTTATALVINLGNVSIRCQNLVEKTERRV